MNDFWVTNEFGQDKCKLKNLASKGLVIKYLSNDNKRRFITSQRKHKKSFASLSSGSGDAGISFAGVKVLVPVV